MIEDVYEPLARYRDEFREKFSRLTQDKFKELTERSGVDVEANRRQVRLVRTLEAGLKSARWRRTLYGVLMTLGYLAAIALVFLAAKGAADVRFGFAAGAVAGLGLGVWMTFLFGSAGKVVVRLELDFKQAKGRAWEQLQALNRLYSWDIPVKLIEATVPRLAFDPFFTARRLNDLKRIYGLEDAFNADKSVIFAQSGVINGNPFLFGEYLEMEWGSETYTGTLDIEWKETERDAEGKARTVTRYETLTATVEKPIPRYSKRKVLIYGNDAAPNLSFSRRPSGLAGAGEGFFASVRKRWRLSRLKAYARDLDDSSQFTLMSNHEFETLFHAKDRDHEVEFRLLFTALAQTQMLSLLKDKAVGYGDDFEFCKRRKLNYLVSRHLNENPIDTAPERFRDWDYDAAARNFQRFNEEYFRSVYFALAPVLAIPLYQQTRTHEEIWKGVVEAEESSFWEHEAIANYYGAGHFAHPDCVTQSILKTRLVARRDAVSKVAVIACGYRGEARVEHKEVRGGDGKWHSVPVEWVEYLPVERTTDMYLSEASGSVRGFDEAYAASSAAVCRRAIRSFL